MYFTLSSPIYFHPWAMYSSLNCLSEDQREAGPALFTKANLMGNQGACFYEADWSLLNYYLHWSRDRARNAEALLNLENVLSLIGALSLNYMPWFYWAGRAHRDSFRPHECGRSLEQRNNKTKWDCEIENIHLNINKESTWCNISVSSKTGTLIQPWYDL